MEGSSHIFKKNYFNHLTIIVLLNRTLYEKIILEPKLILEKRIRLSDYYFQQDYAFPNVNFCTYEFGDFDQKMNRIQKMYYCDDEKKDKYWFKIIF